MNVCLIASSFHPTIGGAETYALVLARGLADRGHDVVVLTDGVKTAAPAAESLGPVRVYRLTAYRDLVDSPTTVAWEQMYFGLLQEAQEVLAAHDVDVVHANSLEAAVLGGMIAPSLGAPFVCSYHEQAPEAAPFGYGRCSLVFSSLPVDAFIAGSEFYRDRAVHFGAADRTSLVYAGVNLKKFTPGDRQSARQALGLPQDATVVVCPARLTPRKGLLELVRATAAARREVPDLHTVIAGSTNSGSEAYAAQVFAEIEKSGLERVVHVMEGLHLDDMPALHRAADIAVMPSLSEGLGLALLEAMACGVPPVGSDIPGIREILRDDVGRLVPAGDVEALARTLTTLAHDPELRKRLGAAAQAHVVEKFDAESTIDQVIGVYERLVSARSAASAAGDPR